jgi:pimeloyl-ACP methyl ester carboxylesterase
MVRHSSSKFATTSAAISRKHLELLHQLVLRAARVAVFVNPANAPKCRVHGETRNRLPAPWDCKLRFSASAPIGGSAGGYTTLAALTFRDFFQGGARHYGVSDIAALARDTHKFESRYLDWLIGPYPQEEARYRERSPLCHADRLAKPVIFFQGEEDAIVPPNQAESMVEALRRKGNPVGYFLFSGEQHGFPEGRQHSTLPRCGTRRLWDRSLPDRAHV